MGDKLTKSEMINRLSVFSEDEFGNRFGYLLIRMMNKYDAPSLRDISEENVREFYENYVNERRERFIKNGKILK